VSAVGERHEIVAEARDRARRVHPELRAREIDDHVVAREHVDVNVDLAGAEFGVYPAGTIASFGHDLVPLAYGAHGLILLDVVLDGTTTVPAMLDLGSPVSVLNSSAAVLMAAKGNIVPNVARTENTTLTPVDMLVSDRGTFARLGLAYRPAAVLGTDVFEGRLLAISYRDRVAFVSKSGRI